MTILPARITGSQFGSSLNTLVNTWMDIGKCLGDVMQRPEVSTLVLHLLPFARAPSILNWTIGSGTGFCSEVYVTRVSPLARWSATSREAQFPNIYQSGPLADPQRTESDHEVYGPGLLPRRNSTFPVTPSTWSTRSAMVAPFLLFGVHVALLRCNLFRLGSQIRARHRGLDKQLTLPRQHPHHDDRLEPPPDSAINIGLPTSRWPMICPAENAASKDSEMTAPPLPSEPARTTSVCPARLRRRQDHGASHRDPQS